MSTNLHELTKQLDALTYNSRSVLNALIRSVMAAGSSTGWTVERAGEPVTLTRTDIFLLSTFYTEWEYTRFNQNEFDPIRIKLDAQFADGQGMVDNPVSYAIMQHSKIMTMTTADAGIQDDTYWLKKVKKQVNPKMFTNTAPIPINIRTPIYDENLSTKHFDQFETYLFPRSYYTLDTLGFSGDNASHVGGGREWYFDVDDKMTIAADRTVIGVQNKEIADVREICYTSHGTLNSIAGGTDSYAYAQNSIAYGLYNQVNGKNAAAVGGKYNMVYGENGGILGGNSNTVVGINGAIGGGSDHFVVGNTGFAANEYTSVGGYPFYFCRYVNTPNAGTVTECVNTFTTDDGCVYNLDLTGGAGTGADASGTIGPNQILIVTEELLKSGFGLDKNCISSGRQTDYGYADLKVGDNVTLVRPHVLNDGNIPNMASSLDRNVTALDRRSYGLVVTFDSPVNRFPGINGEVINGFVIRRHNKNIPFCNNVNEFYKFDNSGPYASAAFGFNTVAGGLHQMVVGQSNYELLRPLFIVGNGSSYIDVDTKRHNAMVVAKNYSYMSTSSHYVNFGISEYSTASQYVQGDEDYEAKRVFDEDYLNYGIEKYAGIYAYEMDDELNDDTRAILRVHHNHTYLGVGRSGLTVYPMSTEANPNKNAVLLEAESHEGAIAIHSGSWLYDRSENASIENNWIEYYNQRVRVGRAGGDKSIAVWALDNVGIHGTGGIDLNTSKYINADYGSLTLHGNSYGALTADTSEYRGLMDFQLGTPTSPQVTAFIKYPGHYFMYSDQAVNDDANEETGRDFVKAYHVISNTHLLTSNSNGSLWSTAQLILPACLTFKTDDQIESWKLPHPKIQVHKVEFPDDKRVSPTKIDDGILVQELAYLNDVKSIEKKINVQFVGGPNMSRQVSETTSSYAKICEVYFSSVDAAYTGLTFAFSIRDINNCNNQGFVCFSLGENNIDGVILETFKRQGSNGMSFNYDKVAFLVQKYETDPTRCTIWFTTNYTYTFLKTLKLLSGDARVEYYETQEHLPYITEVIYTKKLGWKILEGLEPN